MLGWQSEIPQLPYLPATTMHGSIHVACMARDKEVFQHIAVSYSRACAQRERQPGSQSKSQARWLLQYCVPLQASAHVRNACRNQGWLGWRLRCRCRCRCPSATHASPALLQKRRSSEASLHASATSQI
jgi:hypothetical protein